jgi:hypothetical protein
MPYKPYQPIKVIPILPSRTDEDQSRLYSRQSKVSGSAFNVEVKERGKWVSQNVAFSKEQAGLLAQKRLKQTLAATARIVPVKKAIQKANILFTPKKGEFRQYRISKGRKIATPGTFIQEIGGNSRPFSRLGTKAEVSEIKASKRKKKGGIFL